MTLLNSSINIFLGLGKEDYKTLINQGLVLFERE
jgi:hypothetical protein